MVVVSSVVMNSFQKILGMISVQFSEVERADTLKMEVGALAPAVPVAVPEN
jgi:hypothetical protein